MQCKKIIGVLTALAAAACCTIPTAYAAEVIEESTAVVSEISTSSVYDEYREWSQMDSRWGETPMGGTTIRRSGCLVTSLAIMAVHSGSIDGTAMNNMGISSIEQFNPGVLANAYTDRNGFSYDGAIVSWGTIGTIIPNIAFGADKYFQNTEKTAVAEELKSLMAEGWHIIARVNNGGFHWAYIESVGADGSITMCDPAVDTHDLYEAYPNGLQGEYWMLKGTNPPSGTTAEKPALPVLPDSPEAPETPETPETPEVPSAPSAPEAGPVQAIKIASKPDRLVFNCGEELDLTGGVVTLSGMNSDNTPWSKDVDMTSAEEIIVDASAFDSENPGEYEIIIKTVSVEAQATVSLFVTVCRSIGEYCVISDEPAIIYSEQGEGIIQHVLKKGDVIHIAKWDGDYGMIASMDITGWVETAALKKTLNHLHTKGDINDDGNVDKYDLSLLNNYLQQKEVLPSGISTLTAVQLFTADLNDDGMVDLQDVREYLMKV